MEWVIVKAYSVKLNYINDATFGYLAISKPKNYWLAYLNVVLSNLAPKKKCYAFLVLLKWTNITTVRYGLVIRVFISLQWVHAKDFFYLFKPKKNNNNNNNKKPHFQSLIKLSSSDLVSQNWRIQHIWNMYRSKE